MTPDTSAALGEQLLPKIVDNVASSDPTREYACIARDFDPSKGIITVTFAHLAKAINGLAHWIDAALHLPAPFSTIAYLGVPDVRHTFIMLAAVKCGHKESLGALFLSPRNTAEINAKLIDRAGGIYVVHSPELKSIAEGIANVRPHFKLAGIPSLIDCIEQDSPSYSYDKSYEDAWREPVAVLHSSGSTGEPKLVTITHGTLASSNADRWIPVPKGRKPQNSSLWDFPDGGRYYSCFPPFHLAGVTAVITMPIRYRATIVMGAPTLPPSGALVKSLMDSISMRAVYLPPTIAEQWIREPGAFEQAKKLEWILFSGGPLATNIGNELCKHTVLTQIFGSLETGQAQLLVPDPPTDWEWLEFNPEDDIDMREELEGVHELILIQTEKSKPRRMLTYNFPDVEEWQTGDLFVRHPTKAGLWKFIGRKDDLLVLSSGHKFQPVSMESELLGHECVTGVLVVGLGRFQPAVLLEIRSAVHNLSDGQLREQIWPAIEAANGKVQEYGRISADKVAFIREPFVRAGKGTVIRGLTTQKFATTIASLYEDQTSSTANLELFQKNPHQFILSQVQRLTRRPNLKDDEDIFAGGLDSLLTAELSRTLVAASVSGSTIVTIRDIYEHPTVASLTSFVKGAASKGLIENSPTGVQKLVDQYTSSLPEPKEIASVAAKNIKVAILGSRGSLGSALVKSLLSRKEISGIFCLDRKKSGVKSKLNDKIINLEIDLSLPRLGLSSQALDALSSAKVIIHNAWRVDFNLSLASFEPEYIRSVSELVGLSHELPLRPRIVFVSSIAATANWDTSNEKERLPEEVISDSSVSGPRGYGYAKLTCELILDAASKRSGTPVTILRAGQIAGPTMPAGEWSRREAIYALVQASKTMGLVPSDLHPIDWIPSDSLAAIITDILIHDAESPHSISTYNLVNPNRTPWDTFVAAAKKRFPAEPVSSAEWMKALENLSLNNDAANQVPAVKLMDYFRSLTASTGFRSREFASERCLANSTSFKDLRPIDQMMIEAWLTQWGF